MSKHYHIAYIFFLGNVLREAIYFSPQHYTSHTKAHCLVYNVSVFIVSRGQNTI
uniref:Uncharacterized protein n=1 Tax=Arundo donax TaxID=35708 RepID=A0A0A9FNI0_ARUDO